MNLTHFLFKMARASADGRAVRRAVETGSLKPLERRMANKAKGRLLFGRRGPLRGLWK